MLGNNMFAYCGNNPVNYSDPTGSYYRSPHAEIDALFYEGIGGGHCPGGGGGIGEIIEYITNEDESVVLEAEYVAFYKGTLVIRTNMDRSGSCGIIFLSRKENERVNPEDVVRHEYGHIYQLKQLGLFDYLLCIGIPSYYMWGEKSYYDKPWEVIADVVGGVQSRTHSEEDILAGWDYLDDSDRYGVIAWCTIK